jgi:hypothetical protein
MAFCILVGFLKNLKNKKLRINISLFFIFNKQVFFKKKNYSQTCVLQPTLGPKKSARLKEMDDKTEI